MCDGQVNPKVNWIAEKRLQFKNVEHQWNFFFLSSSSYIHESRTYVLYSHSLTYYVFTFYYTFLTFSLTTIVGIHSHLVPMHAQPIYSYTI